MSLPAIIEDPITWQGIQGEPGKDGTNGRDGRDGRDGTPGRDGIDGSDGLPGPVWRGEWKRNALYAAGDIVQHEGSAWIASQENKNVAPRDDSTNWELLAAKGAKGEQGAAGIGSKGRLGPMGEPGSGEGSGEQGIQDETGPQGEQGEQGIQGIQGEPGDTGPQGDPGTNGVDGIPVLAPSDFPCLSGIYPSRYILKTDAERTPGERRRRGAWVISSAWTAPAIASEEVFGAGDWNA